MEIVERQRRIRERLGHGGSLGDVEREIIAPAPFDEDEKAALWLYAWCESSDRRDRNRMAEFADQAGLTVPGPRFWTGDTR